MSLSHTNSSNHAQRLPMTGQTERLSGAAEAVRAVQVGPERRVEALERLLAVRGVADRSHVQRFLDFSTANQIPLDAMWSSIDEDGRFVHTALVVPSPGKTAMFFASHPVVEHDVRSIGALVRHAIDSMPSMQVHLAQSLLDPGEQLDREMFLTGGFLELANLSYMERPVPRSRRGWDIQWPSDVTLHAYDDSHEDKLLSVLEASYEDTLDCPGLRGLRETRDIMQGHQSTGVYDPSLWTVLHMGGEPAGALLLNSSPQQKSVELVYLGLAVKARGRGLGRMLLRHGLSQVAGRAERTMTLAVDERNAPALALYRAERFRCVLRRVAMIRPMRDAVEASA